MGDLVWPICLFWDLCATGICTTNAALARTNKYIPDMQTPGFPMAPLLVWFELGIFRLVDNLVNF